MWRPPAILVWIVTYATVMALILIGLQAARQRIIASLSTPEALASWRAWADETQRPAGDDQPVARRPVTSDEPPALILMRDHFAVVLAVGLIIGTFLFLFVGFLASGLMRERRTADQRPNRNVV